MWAHLSGQQTGSRAWTRLVLLRPGRWNNRSTSKRLLQPGLQEVQRILGIRLARHNPVVEVDLDIGSASGRHTARANGRTGRSGSRHGPPADVMQHVVDVEIRGFWTGRGATAVRSPG